MKQTRWLRRADPWEVARLQEAVEIPFASSIELRGGTLQAIPGRPSGLIGIPFDRPVIGYGGKTINTLRLWAAAAPDCFDCQWFSSGDFVGALADMHTVVVWSQHSTVTVPSFCWVRVGVRRNWSQRDAAARSTPVADVSRPAHHFIGRSEARQRS